LRRPGYRKSEESRRQVLDAAVLTLSSKGLAASSVQDIADAAGVSKGAVHYHFESKDELLHRVLERCCESLEARARAAFEEPGTPMERLRRAVFEMWTLRRDGAPEIRVLSEMHVHARQSEPMRASLGAALRKARSEMIASGLERLVEMGLRPRVSLQVVPRLILAALDGLAMHHLVDPVTPDEEIELLKALEVTAFALFEL
jgi:AcrR family transcriptional regulator